ncbi:hypothetical protein QJS10_CPB04g00518 [Acorus calamus]|uniref:PWWP domain-containing protein n=1 Tax=Acorus calamus TaxID=4465 RepID=A0AAV9F113_ACOCL|nr:hypothetical protein QJS10_CPB04g00518 [Acorus calamus]
MATPGVDSMVREKHFSGRRDRKLSAMNPNEKSKRRRKSEKKKMSRVSRFETGDFVWAKAFLYTWWPGRVYLRGVSTVSVAFFGCDKTRRFCVTDVRDFEEDYPQMIRTVEARLEDEIDRVLGEFGKSVERKGLSGFRAEEVLGFVKEMAVSKWVGDSGAASV